MLVAEELCAQGMDVLLVVDDLYTHAKYLREIGLLMGRLPGRESYPGDIFYQQAHLIERAGSFADKHSITFLPVLQTDMESTTDLIMTNVMGTTDGHVTFSSKQYAQGVFPPIRETESVTRVGKHTQSVVQKQLSTAVTTLLSDVAEQERYVQFGSQSSETTQTLLHMGHSVRKLLDQDEALRLPVDVQAVLVGLVFTTFIEGKDENFIDANIRPLTELILHSPACEALRTAVVEAKKLEDFLQMLEKEKEMFLKVCQM
jgi:F-type H+-transporting ATPase subunit alpha